MRRFVFILCGVSAVFALTVLLLPWWWGAALRTGAKRAGVEFGDYTRIGYARWAVDDVKWSGDAGQFTAKHVELPHPLLFAWHGSESSGLRIDGWHWVGTRSKPEADGAAADESSAGWRATFVQMQSAMKAVQRWVPEAEATNGVLEIAGTKTVIARTEWTPSSTTLVVIGVTFGSREFAGDIRWDAGAAQIQGKLTTADGAAVFTASKSEALLKGTWWEQPVEASATFGAEDWLPAKAEVAAQHWELPGDRLGLGGRYAVVKGDARGDWANGGFKLHVFADGDPSKESGLPPLKLAMAAHGDLHTLIVDALDATGPGLDAHLSAPVILTKRNWDEAKITPAHFSLRADIAALTQDAVKGKISGRVELNPSKGGWPELDAALTADDVQWQDWPKVSGRGRAALRGNEFQLSEWDFEAGDNSRIKLQGKWNFESKMARDVIVHGRLASRWVERWLPAQMTFKEVAVTAQAEGAWPALHHEGTFKIENLTWGALNPSEWSLDWQGEGVDTIKGALHGSAGKSGLALDAVKAGEEIQITDLTLQRADGEQMTLVKPTALTWSTSLRVEKLILQGADDGLELSLGENVTLHLLASRLEKAWMEEWIDLPGPAWFIDHLAINGSVINGVWQGPVEAKAAVTIGEMRSAQFDLAATFGADGVVVERGNISEGARPILTVIGRLAFKFTPTGAGRQWSLDERAPLSAKITSASNPDFWQQMNRALGVEIDGPVINAQIEGSWAKPSGEITMRAERLHLDAERWGAKWPDLTRLNAHLTGDGEGVVIDTLTARISGQEVKASGRLSLNRKQLELLRDDPWSWLREAGEGRVEIPHAELASWATLAPGVLAPTGILKMSLAVSPGGKVDGSVELSGAATRPLGPLGALQDLKARVRFENRQMTIESVEAQTGGRAVVLKGSAVWRETGGPKLDLSLTGENLPLVRQTGLLLRGDVDLKLRTEDDGITWVRGGVKLRDGLFLVDLQSLRPSTGGSSAERRPPYFSVEQAPFADWRLDLAVKGTRFMRLETPVFSGRASADFHLDGTLREPRAVGETTVTEGRVRLPFANFEVTEGWVRLLQSNPYVPQISFIGVARRLGYDLRMELTGTTTTPKLQFFSSPPLASEEVLLLVMAGEAPQDEVSYSASQRATKLGAYLGQSLINQFTGHTDGEERLSISSGEKVSREGRETYRIEYNLDDRWSLVGEYDEFDDYNAGVKWKIYSSDRKKKGGDER